MDINKKTFKIFGVILLSSCLSESSNAESLTKVVVQHDSSTDSYTMRESGKMYFSNDHLIIDTLGNGNILSKPIRSITKLNFEVVQKSTAGEEMVLYSTPSLSTFPNPVIDYVTIQTDLQVPFDFVVYSVDGKILLQGVAKNGEPIDFSSLPNGVYFIKVNQAIIKINKL